MDYSEKLRDPRWQKKRLEIMQRDNFKCQGCNSKEKTLHVHHKTYIFGKNPWDYTDTNFITLCFECHEIEESFKTDVSDYIHDLLLMGTTYQDIYKGMRDRFKSIEK